MEEADSGIDLNLARKRPAPPRVAKDDGKGKDVKRGGAPVRRSKEEETLSSIQLFKEIPQRIPFMGRPREHTVSVALPVSLVQNVQSDELRAYVIGNIARILTIYGINEVILYNDLGKEGNKWQELFALNLRYLETPQYLRKFLFPMNYGKNE